MAEEPEVVASKQPRLPRDPVDATVKVVGEVFNALKDVKDRVQDEYLTSNHPEADVVSLALTVLQRAVGKSIIIVDPVTGRQDKSLTAAVLWKPSND